MTAARVVVLIPHHDDTDGLLRSLASIRESFPVDVVVVDDGSPAPPRRDQLQAALTGDGTVHLVCLARNQGIARALNVGLARCHQLGHPYVARLDAGDRNRPGRLGAQVAVLDGDRDVGAVGSWVQAIHPDGRPLFRMQPPSTHDAIVARMVVGNPMPHPTLLLRRSVLPDEGYPEDLEAAEDFGLVAALAGRTRLANVPEVLVDKEIDPASISSTRRRAQVRSRVRVIATLPAPWWRRAAGVLRNGALLLVSRDMTTRAKQLRRR